MNPFKPDNWLESILMIPFFLIWALVEIGQMIGENMLKVIKKKNVRGGIGMKLLQFQLTVIIIQLMCIAIILSENL